MRRVITADAIVLSATDVGEGDRILTFLTREHGLLRAAASSARDLRKGRNAPLDLFVRSQLNVHVAEKGGKLKRIGSAEIKEPFLGIRSDYGKLCVASYMSELLSRCVQEDDPAREIFELSLIVLEMLEKGMGSYQALVTFEGRFLKELGMAPDTQRCMKCGDNLVGETVIDPPGGGFLHRNCCRIEPVYALTIGDLNILRYIMTRKLSSLPRLTIDEKTAIRLFKQLNRFSGHYLGFIPRTLKSLP